MGKWVGARVKRTEDPCLLTGKGSYLDDRRPLPTVWHTAILRSPYAHVRILRADTSRTRDVPGVVGVLTPDDVLARSDPS